MIIEVHNIKCGGCMNTIKKSLLNITGVESVVFSEDKESVEIIGTADRAVVVSDLERMGYPEKGSNNLLHKTKSFVSCAVGRVSGEE
jgi:copper chaperone CopZ